MGDDARYGTTEYVVRTPSMIPTCIREPPEFHVTPIRTSKDGSRAKTYQTTRTVLIIPNPI